MDDTSAERARVMTDWPDIPYRSWSGTCTALHLWSQIVGKYRLAHTPWVNHSWHATLYVTARGLTTGPVPDDGKTISLSFDFRAHRLVAECETGQSAFLPLRTMSVADFFRSTKELLREVGGTPRIHGVPNEIADPIPFAEDTAMRTYESEAVERFHSALVQIERVFAEFRTSFLGKVSPVHLFWGSFDLAVTRFSGRPAPLHPGGIPNLPNSVTHEAYSHQVSSAGFWPGGNGIDEAMFYSYAYPFPDGFASADIEPDRARWDAGLHEFLLPYDAVRTSASPRDTLMAFLQSTYGAAADLGQWDRAALECKLGRPRIPRPVR